MRGLNRASPTSLGTDERGPTGGEEGAVVVFVAVIIAVLLGFVGMTIDVGAMYVERRQLQNGADAAALAIAEACARGEITCNAATAYPTAQQYADANSADGAATVEEVSIDLFEGTVTVHTSTLTSGGSTVLPSLFARVLGFEGATVHAVAVAEWGIPQALRNFLPLVISACEWQRVTTIPSEEMVLYFHQGNNQNPCKAQAGLDADGDGFLPGGFGWLDTPGKVCETYLIAETWTSADPGSSPTSGCSPSYLAAITAKPIPLPVFDDISGQGSGGHYHLYGFSFFQITGYNFGGQFKLNPPCSGDDRCLSGYFTTGVIFDGEAGGGVDMGLTVVRLIR